VLIDEDDQGQQTLRDLGTNENNTVAFNLYRDVKVVLEDRPLPAGVVNDPQDPFMRIDNTTQPPIAVLGTHPWDSVDTSIDFTQAQPDEVWKQPLFAYPFDMWSGSIVLAMTVRDEAISANLSNGFVFQIADAMLADSTRECSIHLFDTCGLRVLVNWRITVNVNNTCSLDGSGCELHLNFTGKRPGLVVFSALIAVIVNWCSTIGIFLLTCESVVMRRSYIFTVRTLFVPQLD
jgi:hypothetical protein